MCPCFASSLANQKRGFSDERQVNMLKQYMVVKVVKDLGGGMADLIPYIGLLTKEAAEQVAAKAMNQEPGSSFMIQEVGAA